jgi:hypothetical protein
MQTPREPVALTAETLGRQSTRVAACVIVLMVIVGSVAVWLVRYRLAAKDFSKWQWMVSVESHRRDMAVDYLSRHFHAGMSLRDLLADLGEPTKFNDYWCYPISDDDAPVDVLRPYLSGRGLCVWFDTNGKATHITSSYLADSDALVLFESSAWRSAAGHDRTAMARSLIDEGVDGMSKQEVLDMLGPPGSVCETTSLQYLIEKPAPDSYVWLRFQLGDGDKIVDGRLDF